jgi:tetratricopeptide (TPR) repeat protein
MLSWDATKGQKTRYDAVWELPRTRDDFQGQIYGLNNLATVLVQAGSFEAAQETLTEALTIARSVKNQQGEGLSLSNLGLAAAGRGNYFEAIKRYQAALTLRSQSGDPLRGGEHPQ